MFMSINTTNNYLLYEKKVLVFINA